MVLLRKKDTKILDSQMLHYNNLQNAFTLLNVLFYLYVCLVFIFHPIL